MDLKVRVILGMTKYAHILLDLWSNKMIYLSTNNHICIYPHPPNDVLGLETGIVD